MNRMLRAAIVALPKPSYANVVASLALVVALTTGGAVAATAIDSRQIRDNSVTSADIRNGTISYWDMSRYAIRALKGGRGVQGPQGVQGIQGPQGVAGPAGPAGVSGYTVVSGSYSAGITDFASMFWVTCPTGTRALGGGLDALTPSDWYINTSEPIAGGIQWQVYATYIGTTGGSARVTATCAKVSA